MRTTCDESFAIMRAQPTVDIDNRHLEDDDAVSTTREIRTILARKWWSNLDETRLQGVQLWILMYVLVSTVIILTDSIEVCICL